MIECEPANDSSPIAQGDVIHWKLPRYGHSLGIIVTADCDIAWNKFGNFLTYVPVLPLPEYLSTTYMPGQCKSAATTLLRQIAEQVGSIQRRSRPEFSNQITAEALEQWLLHSEPQEIIQALNAPKTPSTSALEKSIANWRQLTRVSIAGADFALQVETLIQSVGTTEVAINKKIHKHVQQLPGDRLYLSTLSGEDANGFVVLIRNLREIADDEIAVNVSQLRARSAKRVARLRSPYRYRLTQQLADVFAAIGLPETYEQRRDELLLESYRI